MEGISCLTNVMRFFFLIPSSETHGALKQNFGFRDQSSKSLVFPPQYMKQNGGNKLIPKNLSHNKNLFIS